MRFQTLLLLRIASPQNARAGGGKGFYALIISFLGALPAKIKKAPHFRCFSSAINIRLGPVHQISFSPN
jgi:hypothetical protein